MTKAAIYARGSNRDKGQTNENQLWSCAPFQAIRRRLLTAGLAHV